jgi:CDP-glucose 4,6-dehydratase
VPIHPGSFGALFGGVYANRRVLVTGHTGFKGSWLTLWLEAMGAQVSAFALPAASQPNHAALLGQSLTSSRVDLRDRRAVHDFIARMQPDIVFHLGAQAIVTRSYTDPHETFDVNVLGLVHLLDAVRASASVRAVVIATSDKCYRNSGTDRPFSEDDSLGGHDPYSASKACAELVTASYRASVLGASVAVATARAGNVIGGGDWAESRLVPDLARGAAAGTPVRIRSPHAVRPWQHVLEPLAGYLLLGERLLAGGAGASHASSAWNFGPPADGHLRVEDVADAFTRHWPALRTVHDRSIHPHESPVLRLDCRAAREQLGWRPVWSSDIMLQRTVQWYRAYYHDGGLRTPADLSAYVADARRLGLPWAHGKLPDRAVAV